MNFAASWREETFEISAADKGKEDTGCLAEAFAVFASGDGTNAVVVLEKKKSEGDGHGHTQHGGVPIPSIN